MFTRIRLIVLIIIQASMHASSQDDTLIFKPVINQTLQHCDIRKISIAKDGKMWLSTNKGIASFDGTDVHFFGHRESDISSMWTSSISLLKPYEDSKGNLYVVTISGPTYYLDTRTGKTSILEIASNNSANYTPKPYNDIYIENDTSIWLAKHEMGFLHFEIPAKKTTFYSLGSGTNPLRNNVTAIRKDTRDEEIVWLASNNGIYNFNKKLGLLKRNFACSHPEDSSAADIEISSMVQVNDTIWFTATQKGVGFYEINTGRYAIYPFQRGTNGISAPDIQYFQRKNKDEYYVGMTKASPVTFNTITHQYSFRSRIVMDFQSPEIQSFIVDPRGNCWCLIFGQLYYASNRRNRFITVPVISNKGLEDRTIIFRTVLWDKNRLCYYAAFDQSDKIFVLDKNLKPLKSIPGPLTYPKDQTRPESTISDIGLDNKGRLWMTGDILSIYDSIKQKMEPVADRYPHLKFTGQRFQNLLFRGNYLYTVPLCPSCTCIYKINTDNFNCDSIPLPGKMLERKRTNQFGVLEIDNNANFAYISNRRTLYQLNLANSNIRLVKGLRFPSMPFGFYPNFHWYELDDDDHLWVSSNGTIRVFESRGLNVLRKIKKDQESYLLQSTNFAGHGAMGFANSTGIELFDYRNNMKFKLSQGDGLITNRNSGIACANNIVFTGAELNALQYLPLTAAADYQLKRSCYLSNIQIFNQPYATDSLPEYLHFLRLPYDRNFITLTFSSTEFEQPEELEYRYQLAGVDKGWVYTNYLNRTITYHNLKPNNYTFYISIKNKDGSWSDSDQNLHIVILPAWWQTGLFKFFCILASCLIAYILIQWRTRAVRKQEQQKSNIKREILEMEAKALRAQMNPHFVFNCLNSIKSLIQEKEEDKAVGYLTTFSKLIRTLFNNADKKEISLYDEIETCRFYLQLEAMRFGTRFSYSITSDKGIDLKSIQVPALIVQPLIENAIWHGIVPKETGGHVSISVEPEKDGVEIRITDDGIGRNASRQNKSGQNLTHQSKGVNLTVSRLNLDNILQQRKASMEIIDNHDQSGSASGTTVIIKIREEL